MKTQENGMLGGKEKEDHICVSTRSKDYVCMQMYTYEQLVRNLHSLECIKDTNIQSSIHMYLKQVMYSVRKYVLTSVKSVTRGKYL